ncbi:hypothetical protein FVER53590_30317 [Fusarium verticillioides]|nr:hypothetical protein FVER53590_30317 [Fusarium verticillioides]
MMDRMGVSPISRNYHLFYSCISNSNPQMRRAVKHLGRFPSQDDLDSVIEEFCPEAIDSKMAQQHDIGFLKAIAELSTLLRSEQTQLNKFNSALDQVSEALIKATEREKVTVETLVKVASAIGEAGKHRAASGKQLAQKMDANRNEIDVLREELLRAKKLANTDPLTGLANRRSFDEQLATAIGKLSTPILLLIDIDHFKMINDSYGHAFGDHVLKVVAREVSGVLGQGAFFARTGGEEFAIILMKALRNEAVLIAERVRKTVEGLVLRIGESDVKVTVSLGLASAESAATTNQLYEAADTALYRSKDAGRNRVTFYDTQDHNNSSNRYKIYAKAR